MTPDRERWAEALLLEKQHGPSAPRWIAEQIGRLALDGDEAGVRRFQQIAAKLDELMTARLPS